MIQALEFYWLALIVACLFGVVISYMGIHLIARKQALVLIPQSQVTVISILIGILLFHEEENAAVIIFSFLMTLLFGLLFQKWGQKLKSFSAEWMLGGYFVLMAIGHSLTRFFPILESHFHQSFQGDIVTADNSSLYISLTSICILGLILMRRYKRDRTESFEIAIGKDSQQFLFNLVISIALTIGVYLLGSAFTVGFLILPSLILAGKSGSYKQHVFLVFIMSLLSSLIGFLLSLEFSFFATTPTMILTVVFLSYLVGNITKRLK